MGQKLPDPPPLLPRRYSLPKISKKFSPRKIYHFRILQYIIVSQFLVNNMLGVRGTTWGARDEKQAWSVIVTYLSQAFINMFCACQI